MSPVNVAVVGYGLAGKVFHAPLVAATEGLRLHSIVSSRAVEAKADWPGAAIAASFEEVLANPEVGLVVLATPDQLHAVQAQAALEAGKAVVVDKPMAVTLSEARRLASAAEALGGFLSVFQNRRWDGDFLTLRQIVKDGVLGEIALFESAFNRFRPAPRQAWKEAREGGVLQDLGPHMIDQALVLFGPPLGIYADMAIQRPGGEAADHAHVILRYQRLRVILRASHLTAEPGPRFAVHGDGGSYVKTGLDSQEAALRRGETPGGPGWGKEDAPAILTPVIDGVPQTPRPLVGMPGDYGAYYREVRDALLGYGSNPVPASQALQIQRVLHAALSSAAAGREVSFDETQ